MGRFQCLGSRCEDDCCSVWNVHLDPSDYQRLEHLLSASPSERKRFEESVARIHPAADSPRSYAKLRMTDAGACQFLDSDSRCSLHRQYGESALPDTCAWYPRVVSRIGGRLELSGDLSCPEMARLCLLAEDGLEIDPLDPSLLPRRNLVGRSISLEGEDPYRQSFELVRSVIDILLTARSYPLSSRLFFVGMLALRVDPLFREGAESSVLDDFRREVDALCEPRALDRLHELLLASPMEAHRTMEIVSRTLMALLSRTRHPSFRRVVTQVYASYSGTPPASVRGDSTPVSSIQVGRAARGYLERSRAYRGVLGERIERHFESYARHYWLTSAYVLSPSLISHLDELLARLAILRVLVMGHPRLQAAAAGDDPDPLVEALATVTVEAVYSFHRTVEHNEGIARDLFHAWDEIPNPERLYRLAGWMA